MSQEFKFADKDNCEQKTYDLYLTTGERYSHSKRPNLTDEKEIIKSHITDNLPYQTELDFKRNHY